MDFRRIPEPHDFRGIMIKVLAIIANKLDVCMDFVVPSNSYFGRRLENGSWSGLMAMLNRGEVDMTGTTLTISDERLQAMVASVPLYMDFQTLIYRRPIFESDLLGFVKPYTKEVWLFLAVVLVVVTVSTSVIGKAKVMTFSPPPTIKSKRLEKYDENTTGRISFWTFGSFLGQSIEWKPGKYSGRMAAIVWLLMALIIGIVYRSNLKAMLIAPKLRLPFDSMEELLETNIPCLVLEGTMMHRLYLNAAPGSLLHRVRKQALVHGDIYRATFDLKDKKYAVIGSGLGADNAIDLLYSVPAALARHGHLGSSVSSAAPERNQMLPYRFAEEYKRFKTSP
ncbi:glutamate receptor ionotropic, kainate glr-3-like [Scylla paramamosain]|uniref:glutamate receptor ionotropic, kainate glr-3-like n=1 Tax=Scylla paramamosain TaxID=85552 RepID=UPI003083D7B1